MKVLPGENATGRYYYYADARNSVSTMNDELGPGAWRRYDPWGRVLGTAGTPLQYGYTGREPDLTTGLVYYRARYYDPALERFTSVDPLGPAGGITAHADNAPVSNTDPTESKGSKSFFRMTVPVFARPFSVPRSDRCDTADPFFSTHFFDALWQSLCP